MTNDISLVEITAEISKGRNGESAYYAPQNAKGVSFTLYHKAPHGWGPINVTTYHPRDLTLIADYPPAPGARVTVVGQLKYNPTSKRWMIVIPEDFNKDGGIKVKTRPMMPGLEDATKAAKDEGYGQ